MSQSDIRNMGRRTFMAAGAKLTTVVAFCSTFGLTVLTACPGDNSGDSGDDDGYGYYG